MTAAPRDERLLRAIQYAASALDTDQPLRLTLHASDQSKIIRCNRSSLYRFGVGCLVVFAAALAPFTVESGLGDLTADESRRATTDRTNGVMVGVVALLACDYAGELRMRVGGSRDVVSTRLLLRLIALTVLFANAFARTALLTFAPVVLIWTEFPPLRNVVGAWRSHGATFLGVIAVFVSVLLLFAQLGVLLWADCYDSRMYADDDGADDGGELGVEFCVEFDGAFATLARSALTLFVLSTTENAPFVMWPAVDCGRAGGSRTAASGRRRDRAVVFAAIAYFTAYIVVMVYVVVNFMLGSVYDAWHEGHARVEDEKRALDDDASDAASNAPPLDSDARRDVWRRKWRVAITAIVAAVRLRDADLGAVRRLCRSVSPRPSPTWRTCCARPRRGGARRVEVAFDDGLVAVAFAGRVVLDPALAGVLEKNEWHVCSTSLKRIAGMAVAARLLALSASARSVLVGVSKLKRQIALFAMVFASVVYVYAAVGVALCGDVLPGRERWVYDGDDGSYDDGVDDVLLRHRDRHVMDNRFAFSSFQKAWMTLIEIFLTNNWQDIVNAYLTSGVARRNASPARRSVIALYLVSFYVVSVMFLTNVVVALILDAERDGGAGAGWARRVLAVARFRALGRVRSRSRDPHAPPPPPPPMPWRASSTASARSSLDSSVDHQMTPRLSHLNVDLDASVQAPLGAGSDPGRDADRSGGDARPSGAPSPRRCGASADPRQRSAGSIGSRPASVPSPTTQWRAVDAASVAAGAGQPAAPWRAVDAASAAAGGSKSIV
ncbi:hypothetical protein JL722_10911 [Aureococcus anophagefferens]|nr:hypothetical protein JL722_10911 [Aureococcus anophagefferens]